jgi:hypothetical protein
MRDRAAIKLFFSFMSTYVFVKGEEKQFHPKTSVVSYTKQAHNVSLFMWNFFTLGPLEFNLWHASSRHIRKCNIIAVGPGSS